MLKGNKKKSASTINNEPSCHSLHNTLPRYLFHLLKSKCCFHTSKLNICGRWCSRKRSIIAQDSCRCSLEGQTLVRKSFRYLRPRLLLPLATCSTSSSSHQQLPNHVICSKKTPLSHQKRISSLAQHYSSINQEHTILAQCRWWDPDLYTKDSGAII